MGYGFEGQGQIHPSTGLWQPLNVSLPAALLCHSLAELGFFVPSKLPQGSLETRNSAPPSGGLQHGFRPVRFAAIFNTKTGASPRRRAWQSLPRKRRTDTGWRSD